MYVPVRVSVRATAQKALRPWLMSVFNGIEIFRGIDVEDGREVGGAGGVFGDVGGCESGEGEEREEGWGGQGKREGEGGEGDRDEGLRMEMPGNCRRKIKCDGFVIGNGVSESYIRKWVMEWSEALLGVLRSVLLSEWEAWLRRGCWFQGRLQDSTCYGTARGILLLNTRPPTPKISLHTKSSGRGEKCHVLPPTSRVWKAPGKR